MICKVRLNRIFSGFPSGVMAQKTVRRVVVAEWIISYKCIQFCPERRVCNRTVNGLRGRGHLSSASLTAGGWSAQGELLTSDKESDMLGS